MRWCFNLEHRGQISNISVQKKLPRAPFGIVSALSNKKAHLLNLMMIRTFSRSTDKLLNHSELLLFDKSQEGIRHLDTSYHLFRNVHGKALNRVT